MRRALTLACACAVLPGLIAADIVFDATNTVVTPPMTLVDGVLHQVERTELPQSGTAIVTMNVPVTGEYTLLGLADAPGSDADSFFLEFDQPPAGPGAIWDVPKWVGGFEWKAVTRRGRGNTDAPEFDPMIFNLSAGEHRLFIAGRERAKLRSLRLVPFHRPRPGSLEEIQEAFIQTNKQDARDRGIRTQAERVERWGREHDEQFAAALKIAKANLGQPAGFAALDWIVRTPVSHHRAAGPEALALIRKHYIADPKLGPALALLAGFAQWPTENVIDVEVRPLFAEVLRDNPDRTVRGQAKYGLAQYAKSEAFQLETARRTEEADVARRKAAAMMEDVRREYGDVPHLRRVPPRETLGEMADRQLVELRALTLGMPAPEIVGTDLDGAPIKLSDYRGKVVMVVFWAAWCGPCIGAIPHEKEIVERFKGRPFVLIGVNGDSTLAEANKAVAQNTIPWRSFWNRQDNYISKAWNVTGWPTVYVLDHEGFIQQRIGLDEKELEPLVAAAEAAGRK